MKKLLPLSFTQQMTSDRERFAAVLASGPLLRADALVVLCGEDAEQRMNVAIQLLHQGAAESIVLTGGIDDGDAKKSAATLAPILLGKGCAPSRIIVDETATNTHEQAEYVVKLAKVRKWKRLLLVASAYHMPRAMLTFLAELKKAKLDKKVQIVPVAASQLPWGKSPPGCTRSRLDLLDDEFAKIEAYGAHCATPAGGLKYLLFWEGK